MGKIKLIAYSVWICFICLTSLYGQENKFRIEAESRTRSLVDNGYKCPKVADENAVFYTTQRTRLNACFENDKLETYVSFQDVRLWGDDDHYSSSGVYGNTESLSLHQGWAKLKITEPLSIKIGRQQFSYDDQRIFSARNWNDYQVTYDALLVDYEMNEHRLNLGLSYNADNKSDVDYPSKKFKMLDFLHYQYAVEKATLSCMAVLSGNTLTDSTDDVSFRGTYGVNADVDFDLFDLRLSAYYQHHLNDVGDDVSAYCFSVFAKRNVTEKLNLGIGLDVLSGNDDNSTSATNHRFDILYGRRHGWYGYMDFFSTTPDQGLQDYMLKLTYKPQKRLSVQAHYHYFLLSADKYDANRKMKRQLGNELDLKAKWYFYESTTLEAGYSIYGVTNTLKSIKNIEGSSIKTPQYFYLMLTMSLSKCL